MGTVGASPSLGGLVDLDVLDNKGTGVETLGVSVGLGVLDEVGEELSGLDGPAGAADTPLLAYRQLISVLSCNRMSNEFPKRSYPIARLVVSSIFNPDLPFNFLFQLFPAMPCFQFIVAFPETNKNNRITHPEQHDQCRQRICAWGRPRPCSGRCRGT